MESLNENLWNTLDENCNIQREDDDCWCETNNCVCNLCDCDCICKGCFGV